MAARLDEHDERAATLEEVAKELGISKERARQIEANALRKLRQHFKARGLDVDDLIETRRGARRAAEVRHLARLRRGE